VQSVKVPPVVVYVSPASFKTMREVYSKKVRFCFHPFSPNAEVVPKDSLAPLVLQVPTATILPLYLSEKDLDSRSMLSM
jgi:hypothetical protein